MSTLKNTAATAGALVALFAGQQAALASGLAGNATPVDRPTDAAFLARTAFGGGASLPAPYLRQAEDCFAEKSYLKFRGTPPVEQSLPDFFYDGASPVTPFNCLTQTVLPNNAIEYISTGSGRGIGAIFSNDPALWGDIDADVAGDQLFPRVHYAASETPILPADVNVYNNGGTIGSGGSAVTVPAGGIDQIFGPLVQFPLLIAPVTIAFDPVYKKVRNANGSITQYTLNINPAYRRADGSGGLRLDQTALCRIFNGQITNWNDAYLRARNGNVSLQDPDEAAAGIPFNVPLQIVGRSDSSGTSTLFTRHLAAACNGVPGNQYTNPDGTSTLPSALQGPAYNKANVNAPVPGETVGLFTRADGNDGVAKYLDFTRSPSATPGSTVVQGRVSYVGPDYVLPAVLFTQANNYNLQTADIRNASGAYRAPTVSNALRAFEGVLPPDSNSDGSYNPAQAGSRANPADWVPGVAQGLNNPTYSTAYPIVGTTNYLGYTCYRSTNNRSPLQQFINWYETNGVIVDINAGLLASAGLAPVPFAWRKAIRETFVVDTYNLDLDISTSGAPYASNPAKCPTVGQGA